MSKHYPVYLLIHYHLEKSQLKNKKEMSIPSIPFNLFWILNAVKTFQTRKYICLASSQTLQSTSNLSPLQEIKHSEHWNNFFFPFPIVSQDMVRINAALTQADFSFP